MPTKELIILIPPSEGKTPGGTGEPFKPNEYQQIIMEMLCHYDGDWGKLLDVKGKALKEAIAINQNVTTAPTMPAIQRYSGVVYDGIDYQNLTPTAKKFFDDHVRIVSALFGLVKPKTRIPNYKFKIDKLDAAMYWKLFNYEQLKNKYIIDLLPKAHQKAVNYDDGIIVDFIIEKNGKRKPAGHHGKLIKGKFIHWLCENQIATPNEFPEFQEDGYEWTGDVFLKVE